MNIKNFIIAIYSIIKLIKYKHYLIFIFNIN